MKRCLLFDTICNIDIGIQSRIHTAISDEERTLGDLKEACVTLESLPQKCKEIVTALQDDIEESVKYLSNGLHAYINSPDGKNEILNPDGKKSIEKCFFVSNEVLQRYQDGVMRWMKGENVVHEIERIDDKVLKNCIEVREELEKVRSIIMGNEDPEERTKTYTDPMAVVTASLWLPVAIVVNTLFIVADIVLSPFIAFTKGMKEKQIDTFYTACAQLLTEADFRDKLGIVFKDHFEHRIKRIFEKKLPSEINTLVWTIKFLLNRQKQIRKNLKETIRLKDSLYKIKDDLQKLT